MKKWNCLSKLRRMVVGTLCVITTIVINAGCANTALSEMKSEEVNTVEKYITVTDDKAYKEMAWEYTIESDIVYGQAEGMNGLEELKLDVYKTEKNGMNPAIILFHGGGLTSGDKASAGLLKSLATDYAKMGYVVVVPNYRLGTSAYSKLLKNAMDDARAAYEWVLTNGDSFGIDTNYVAIGGYSSGADIAVNMCYSNYFSDLNYENIYCVISISSSGLYDGMTKQSVPGCVIVHGTSDTTVSYKKSEKLSKALIKKNIDMELNPLEGLNHDLLSRYDEVRNMIAEYMYKKLTGNEVTISIKAEISPEYQKVLERMDNGALYEVKQLDVKLDGVLDEWDGIPEIDLNKVKDAGTSLPTEDDFSGKVMLAWNEAKPTTLYIAARIKDDDIKDTVPADGKWYQDDCLEIVFDTSEKNEVQQLTKWVVGAEGKDLSVLANAENTTVVMAQNGEEHIYELSIDISKVPPGTYQGDINLDFSQEKSIGFSISYNDGEKGDRQHQIGWTSGKSSDRSTLGTLSFK